MHWDRLKKFYHVASFESFTKAATHFNTSQSALSRHVMDLESRLNTKLFYRQPRGLKLTDEGKIWFEAAQKIFDTIQTTRILVDEQSKNPQGSLRVATTNGFTDLYLSLHLSDFLEEFPKIQLSIISTDITPDVKLQETDVLIHPRINDQEGLIHKHLMTFHTKLYASRPYLEKFGIPQSPQDLDQHRLIGFGGHDHPFDESDWHLTLGLESGKWRQPCMEISSSIGLFNAALNHSGIVCLPSIHPGLNESGLVEVLPGNPGVKEEAYCIYPEKNENSKKTQIFIEYLMKKMKQKYAQAA